MGSLSLSRSRQPDRQGESRRSPGGPRSGRRRPTRHAFLPARSVGPRGGPKRWVPLFLSGAGHLPRHHGLSGPERDHILGRTATPPDLVNVLANEGCGRLSARAKFELDSVQPSTCKEATTGPMCQESTGARSDRPGALAIVKVERRHRCLPPTHNALVTLPDIHTLTMTPGM